jgi:hypothetical protein
MSEFHPIKINKEFAEALSEKTIYTPSESKLIKVNPPKNNKGIDASISLYRALYDSQNNRIQNYSSKSESDSVIGTEIWYDEEELKFMFYSPNSDLSRLQRRHIDGFFPLCRIERQKSTFPSVTAGDYITGGNVWLQNHYFEPIRQKKYGVNTWNDPYQMIFNGIDTRDSTRTLVQVLFKPASKNWAREADTEAQDYAQKFTEPITESKYGGLVQNTSERTPEEKKYAKTIMKQVDQQAFHVNLRFVVIADSPNDATTHAIEIDTLFQNGYVEMGGQTLMTDPASTPDETTELVRRTAKRESLNMKPPSGFLDRLNHIRDTDPTRYMIMSINELAGITHLPTADEVSSNSISWTDVSITGVLPPTAKSHDPVSVEERQRQLKTWAKDKDNIKEEFGITEEDSTVKNPLGGNNNSHTDEDN